MYTQKDVQTIRDLCKRYYEIGMSDRHVRMRKRFRDTNDLKLTRPPVIMEEIPWVQMNIDHALDCVCEDKGLRRMEYELRIALLREKYFKCDNFTEPAWVIYKSFTNTDYGLDTLFKETTINGTHTNIQSHQYVDVLEDESALERFHLPVITAHPEQDEAYMNYMKDLVGDSIPVVLRGHGIYHAPWDRIARLRGVESILYDLYDRPEYLHKIRALWTKALESEMDQMDALGLYDRSSPSLHCTPADVTLPEDAPNGGHGLGGIWYRTMAQMFNSISPEDHFALDVQYSIPLAKRCAYTYYGCCEPLDDRIEMLKKIPNLRKVGCSPWANVEHTAEQLRGDYVLSRKPNPANVAIATDVDVVRKEAEETAKVCIKYGCPFDYTLKDISTINDKPENLIVWAQTVSDVFDHYFGEA